MQRTATSRYRELAASNSSRGAFTFPLRALQEEPKPDRLEDNVIADPRPIPFQSELQTGADLRPEHETGDESTEAVLDALAQPDKSTDDIFSPKSSTHLRVKSFRMVSIGMALDLSSHTKHPKDQKTSHQISGECSV